MSQHATSASAIRSLGLRLLLPLLTAAGCGMPVPDARDVVRIGDDLVGGRGELRIAETVPGDVMLAGGSIRFTGQAGGDYLGAGGEQHIGGTIGGAVRAAGGQIEVAADVGRNATIAGGEITVARGGRIEGTAYLAGGSLTIDGGIGGDLRASGGRVVVRGQVDGNVHVESGELRVEDGAVIGGDLVYRSTEGDATIDPGARIAGTTTELPPRPRSPIPSILRIIWLGGFLLAGAVFVLVFHRTFGTAAEGIRLNPIGSLLWGLVWVILVPVVDAIVAITIIGLPLALMIAALYLASLYLAPAVTALWLGRLLLRERVRTDRGGTVLAFTVGAIILVVLELIPILGPIVAIAATVVGVGAFILALRARSEASETV